MSKLLTPKQAARLLKVHRRTLKRWEAAGKLVAVRVNCRLIRFREEDIENFLAAAAAQSQAAQTSTP